MARTRNLTAAVERTVAIAAAVLLTACSNDLTWTEDVRLPDGRTVTLERYVEFEGPRGTESLQRLKFKHPGTGEAVRWENSKQNGTLATIAVWLENDIPMLLTTPPYGGDLIAYKCPNPPYLLFEYVQGQWRSRPLVNIGVDRLRANVTTHPLEARKEIERSKRRLTVEQTSASIAYRDGTTPVPYILEFAGMPEQTFRVYENCNRPLAYLLAR